MVLIKTLFRPADHLPDSECKIDSLLSDYRVIKIKIESANVKQ